MPFDLSAYFGRREKDQFELLDRWCYSVKLTIQHFEESIEFRRQRLQKEEGLVRTDAEMIQWFQSCLKQLVSLGARGERLRADTNSFYRKYARWQEEYTRKLVLPH